LTPNAKKLQVIGTELEKLNRIINDITPVAELPFNVRPKTRKEKNKLASRLAQLLISREFLIVSVLVRYTYIFIFIFIYFFSFFGAYSTP